MRRQRPHRHSVYILGSLSGTLYIGITSNLPFRVRQHKEHTFRGFTAKYSVNRLLYYETYGQVSTAVARERQLKGWKREEVGLIEERNPQWKDLSREWFGQPVRTTFQGWICSGIGVLRLRCLGGRTYTQDDKHENRAPTPQPFLPRARNFARASPHRGIATAQVQQSPRARTTSVPRHNRGGRARRTRPSASRRQTELRSDR
jgi:putative endonuclease